MQAMDYGFRNKDSQRKNSDLNDTKGGPNSPGGSAHSSKLNKSPATHPEKRGSNNFTDFFNVHDKKNRKVSFISNNPGRERLNSNIYKRDFKPMNNDRDLEAEFASRKNTLIKGNYGEPSFGAISRTEVGS